MVRFHGSVKYAESMKTFSQMITVTSRFNTAVLYMRMQNLWIYAVCCQTNEHELFLFRQSSETAFCHILPYSVVSRESMERSERHLVIICWIAVDCCFQFNVFDRCSSHYGNGENFDPFAFREHTKLKLKTYQDWVHTRSKHVFWFTYYKDQRSRSFNMFGDELRK